MAVTLHCCVVKAGRTVAACSDRSVKRRVGEILNIIGYALEVDVNSKQGSFIHLVDTCKSLEPAFLMVWSAGVNRIAQV